MREGTTLGTSSYVFANGYIELTTGTTNENGYVRWSRRIGKTFVSSVETYFDTAMTEGFYYTFFKPTTESDT